MTECPSIVPYVDIDPATNLVVYRDSWGRIWEMPREIIIRDMIFDFAIDGIRAVRRHKAEFPQLWRLKEISRGLSK